MGVLIILSELSGYGIGMNQKHQRLQSLSSRYCGSL